VLGNNWKRTLTCVQQEAFQDSLLKQRFFFFLSSGIKEKLEQGSVAIGQINKMGKALQQRCDG